MSDFKTRLLEEQDQLDEKREKLSMFMNGDNFKDIPEIQQSLLKAQYSVMTSYSLILGERISKLAN